MKPAKVLHVSDKAYWPIQADLQKSDDLCAWVDANGGDHSRTYALELLDEGRVRAYMYAVGYPLNDEGDDVLRVEKILHPTSPPPHWPQENNE